MAKALLGYIGPTDVRTTGEIRRLREQVRELEAEVERLQTENAALAASLHHDDLITLSQESVLA